MPSELPRAQSNTLLVLSNQQPEIQNNNNNKNSKKLEGKKSPD